MMMEFDEIVVKESPGLCRCCLSEGCYKDLGSEYTWMNDTEVYADMLLECFDISITKHNDGPNGPNRLICEVCITRLRDACNFKKQVLDSEKKFIDMMGRGEFRPKMLIYQAQMKCEDTAEPATDDGNVEYLEENIDFGDDELKDESTVQSVSDITVTVTALPMKGKRGRPRKNALVKPEKRVKAAKAEDKAKTSKAVSKGVKNENSVVTSRDGDAIKRIRQLLVDIVEISTAMPFRRHGNKYKCFFCKSCFYLSSDLKKHTREEHTDENVEEIAKKNIFESSLKLDISELQCKMCSEPFEEIDEFIFHLRKHKKTIDEDFSNIIIFKLSDDLMQCLFCKQEFTYFSTLILHINRTHLGKTFICDTCGKRFVRKSTLTKHVETHKTDNHDCKICGRTFNSETRRRRHFQLLHDLENRKCPICSKVLGSSYQKDSHLGKVHNIWKSKFQCHLCTKVYRWRSMLLKHVKSEHLEEKNVTCEVCGQHFFENRLLQLHKVCHTDDKPFQCDFCNKKFPRKKALNLHVRIHTNDKRCVCKKCGKAFVQWASLKCHMKVHHKNDTS